MKEWYCKLVVKIPEGGLPKGFDAQPRSAVEKHFNDVVANFSGWGATHHYAEHFAASWECRVLHETFYDGMPEVSVRRVMESYGIKVLELDRELNSNYKMSTDEKEWIYGN